jgi:16S rRNA (guanine527-N7)-methyltransferase
VYDDSFFKLRDNAGRYGIILSENQFEFLDRYVDELIFWNRKMNLTGLSSRERIFNELVLDSIIPITYIVDKGSMLDVGSGAGFPAIPIKICKPLLEIHLTESNTKKISFLKQVIRLLRLRNCDVIKGRIEMNRDLLHPKGYDMVTAKAFASLSNTIKICSPIIAPGGYLLLFLGRHAEKELSKNRIKIDECSLVVNKIMPYVTPGSESLRHIILLTKRA